MNNFLWKVNVLLECNGDSICLRFRVIGVLLVYFLVLKVFFWVCCFFICKKVNIWFENSGWIVILGCIIVNFYLFGCLVLNFVYWCLYKVRVEFDYVIW